MTEDPQRIDLSNEEVLLLRYTCEIEPRPESPLVSLSPSGDRPRLEASAKALVGRGLVDAASYRPHRDLVRRLLILSEPECHIVLLTSSVGEGERPVDVYGRAGAFVSYGRRGEVHRVGPPTTLDAVLDRLLERFSPSVGPKLIELELSSAEYFAFISLASELLEARRHGEGSAHLTAKRPGRDRSETTLDGEIIAPHESLGSYAPQNPVMMSPPEAADWRTALYSLVDKEVFFCIDDRYELRPYLREIAVGLVGASRHAVARFDFVPTEWKTRDLVLVAVDGRLFRIHAPSEATVRVTELDLTRLKSELWRVIEDA